MKKSYEIIHDCDNEEGNPTCWALEINHHKYGKYIWISKNEDSHFEVEINRDNKGEFETLVVCKTLTSAKRWISSNIL